MKMFKTLTAIVIASMVSVSALAVDLSTTIGNSTSNTIQNVNQSVSGTTVEQSFNYSQNRDITPVVPNACTGQACGNDSLTVGITVEAILRTTNLDQLTTGVVNSTAENCDVTVNIGGLSNSQGFRNVTSNSTQSTVNNNTIKIEGVKIDASTTTDMPYTGHNGGSKLGNDFTLNIGDLVINSEGNSVNVASAYTAVLGADLSDISISGQDLNNADMNAFELKVTTQDLLVLDTGTSTTTSTSTSSTTYQNN